MAKKTRQTLQFVLERTLGSKNVYFQPPESLKMKYPAIRYELADMDSQFGDNIPYIRCKLYEVLLITPNPDDCVIDRISELPMCVMERHYTSKNLHHYVFNLYY